MPYPRLYSEATAAGDHLRATLDWDAMVAQWRGFTPSGTFKSPYDFVIVYDGVDYYACNAFQVVYGGPDDAGGVDGGDAAAVINAAVASDKYVFIAGSDYDLNGTDISIVGVSNCTIVGAGRGHTVLQNGAILKNDAGATYNIVIRDLTVDANNLANHNCINLGTNTYSPRIINCELKNTNNYFLLDWAGVDNLIVEDCVFSDGGLTVAVDNCAGAQLKTTNNTSIFRNNYFVKNASAGSALLTTGATGNILIEGNAFIDLSNLAYAAVSIENFYGTCKSIQVVNNYAYAVPITVGNNAVNQMEYVNISNNIIQGLAATTNGGGGIICQKAERAVISGNILLDGVYGIFMLNIDSVIASNNILHNTDIDSAGLPTTAAFYLSGCGVARVQGNTVTDDAGTTPYAIHYTGGDVYIQDNTFKGPFTTACLSCGGATNYAKITNNSLVGSVIGLASVTTKDVHGNTGFVTESWGKETGVSPILNVAHGLSGAPTTIILTGAGTTPFSATFWGENATDFDIYHDAGVSTGIAWYAKYKP